MSGEYTRALQNVHAKIDSIHKIIKLATPTDEELFELIRMAIDYGPRIDKETVLKDWKEWRSSNEDR